MHRRPMRHCPIRVGVVSVVLGLLAVFEPDVAPAQTPATPEPPVIQKPLPTLGTTGARPGPQIIYRAPRADAPASRLGGGARTRGGLPTGGPGIPRTEVLAPGHTGLTTSSQVALYWFLSGPSSLPVEVTVVHPRQATPLLDVRLEPPVNAGIHRTPWPDQRARLEPGVDYRWSVAIVADPNRRSKDILAKGTIRLIEQTSDLRGRLAKAAGLQVPALYADAGIWYDAVDALSQLIDADPSNVQLRVARASLLEQVTLDEVARYDREHR